MLVHCCYRLQGNNIEPHVIEGRYIRGIKNLFDIYLQLADGAMIIDNSAGEYELFAKKESGQQLAIIDPPRFQLLKKYYDQN
jgi:predicted ABC-type ATPase